MGNLNRRLQEDKALRDAARALIDADIVHARKTFSKEGLSNRLIGNVSSGAADLLDQATEKAEDHRGVLVTLFAAIGLWFARNPILSLFDGTDADDGGEDANAATKGAELSSEEPKPVEAQES